MNVTDQEPAAGVTGFQLGQVPVEACGGLIPVPAQVPCPRGTVKLLGGGAAAQDGPETVPAAIIITYLLHLITLRDIGVICSDWPDRTFLDWLRWVNVAAGANGERRSMPLHRILGKTAAVSFAASALIAGGMSLAPAASASGIIPPCPSQYACLYANPATNGFIADWKTYGSHNLSDVLGDHRFTNNQTGGAKAYLCTGSNGNGNCSLVQAGSTVTVNFTPINSVYLEP